MAIGTDTVSMYVGETVDATFTMSPVVDVAGWTAQFTTGGGALSLTAAVVGDGSTGKLRVSFAAADTSSLTSMTTSYCLRRTDVGSERVLAKGTYILSGC